MKGDALGLGIGDWGLGIYVAGVAWGLLKVDAPALQRLALAVCWPLGPLAFVVTVTLLLIALPVAFPKVGIPLWLAAAAIWWVSS